MPDSRSPNPLATWLRYRVLSELHRVDAALGHAWDRRVDRSHIRQLPAHVAGTPLLALGAGYLGRPIVYAYDIDHGEGDAVRVFLSVLARMERCVSASGPRSVRKDSAMRDSERTR